MSYEAISSGNNLPHDLNAIIEISSGSSPIKYEVDKASQTLWVDRFIATPVFYPINYGYVNHTLCLDGDALDILLIAPLPVQAGSVVRCRPVGLLPMEDESGIDYKILCVPHSKLTSAYDSIQDINDVDSLLKSQIKFFFEQYKGLESGKWAKTEAWQSVDKAHEEILESVKRYQADS